MATISLSENSFTTSLVPDTHVKRVAIIAYIAAFMVGTLNPIAGLASPQIASHFNVNVSHIVYLDVLTLIGILLGNIFSGKLIGKFGGKKTLALSGLLMLIAQYTIGMQNNLYLYAGCVLLSGIGIGFMVPSVSYLIVGSYQKFGKSDARLSVLNFFFGMGSFAGPFVGGLIMARCGWRMAFLVTGSLALIMFLTSLLTKVDESIGIKREKIAEKSQKHAKVITLGVVLIGLGLIAYVYTEYIVSYWFSPYLQLNLNYGVAIVGAVIGTFWLTIAIGRLVFGAFVLTRVKSYHFVIVMALITLIGFVCFLMVSHIVAIFLCVILLGIGCASIFPTMLGYGMQLNGVTPLVTAFLIGSGSVGGALSLFVSGTIGEHIARKDAIYMGPVCAILIIIFIVAAQVNSRKKKV